jgi:hypothetical protein
MHPFFYSLTVVSTPSLHAFFMNIHHDTSFNSILEDDSILSSSRACIHSCLGKGSRLWLVAKPPICSFSITHSTFTLVLHFVLVWFNLRHLIFSRASVDMGWTHLASNLNLLPVWRSTNNHTQRHLKCHVCLCLKNEHVIWREWWYTLPLGVSLWTNIYMI